MSKEGGNSTNMLTAHRNSKVNCCVVGCHNAYYNTDPNLKFYNFPNKWYEKERRRIWINSINRLCTGDTKEQWQPKSHDKICSNHFVGNEKRNEVQDPSYNPTIFPKNYLKTSTSCANSKKERYERLLNRSATKQFRCATLPSTSTIDQVINKENERVLPVPMETEDSKQDFFCQTSPMDFDVEDDLFVFESNNFFDGSLCDVATQCHIPASQLKNFIIQSKDKCVGNDDVIECKGFHGHKSIKSDAALNHLAGMFFDRFALLVSFLTVVHKNSKLTNENRLLLFLMKFKLGLSYSALGVFFQIHHTTCSRIFLSVLEELVQKTKNFVMWPSREIINMTMPKSFKLHFPKCRAIIDCTEIKIQQPKKVDQRLYTYSQYKSTFTAKFLVSIAPTGFISFVSKCYGGRTTDSFLTNDCGFLKLLEPNDVILADKGFPGIKCEDNVVLVLPPFVHDGRLSYEEVEETYTIASVRIHVERSIQRIKIYKILDKVPYNLFQHLDDIVQMCCVFTNLQPPTIADCDNEDDI